MTARRNEQIRDTRGCVFAWCVTEHGATVHPDDEDHRSAGIGVSARVRDSVVRGVGVATEVEIGLLRRAADVETWVIVETGVGVSVSVPVHAARALVAGVWSDAEISGLLVPERDID